MSVTPAQIKELRQRTGVGLMACRKALEESSGDMEQAIELLRKRGEAKATSKAYRDTGEGRVSIHDSAIVKLRCETDFVARNEQFIAFVDELAQKCNSEGVDTTKQHFESVKADKIQSIGENIVLDGIEKLEGNIIGGYVHSNGKLGALVVLEGGTGDQAKDVAMHAVAMDPLVANPEDVDQDLIKKEKAIYRDQLAQEGKPEQIMDKIIEGKVKKFCADKALTSQPFVKDPSQTVADYLGTAKVVQFVRYSI